MAYSTAFSLGDATSAGSELCQLEHPQGRGISDSPGSENSSSFVSKDSPVEAGQCARRKVKYRSVSSSDTRESVPVVSNDGEEGVVLVRPKLRGKIHLGLLLLSPVWVALLLSACSSFMSIIAASVSCLSFLANFAASALLHSGRWGPEWRHLVVKLDHAGIFVVISSCTTPIPILLLDFWPSVLLLSVQGVATLYGFWITLFGDLSSGARQRRAYTYIAIGLLHAVFLKAYINALTSKEVVLVFSLAGLYIIGALVYGSRWPDPCPTHFGFHEVFHLFCFLSFVLTLWLNYEVISRVELAGSGTPQPPEG